MKPAKDIKGVAYRIHKANFLLQKHAERLLTEKLGLSFSHYMILMALRYRPGVSQREIADFLGLTPAAVSRQLDLLHERGLLERSTNPASKREHILVLSAEGERLSGKAAEVLGEGLKTRLDGLHSSERETLTHLLDHLLELLQAE